MTVKPVHYLKADQIAAIVAISEETIHEAGSERFGMEWLFVSQDVTAIARQLGLEPGQYHRILTVLTYYLCEMLAFQQEQENPNADLS